MSYFVDTGVRVGMRDGVKLDTNVWRPADGGPFPVLLLRTPYGKDLTDLIAYGTNPNLFGLIEAGYAIVHQDCRGTFRSGGRFVPHIHEAHDGADTIGWLRQQPWCDGTIGMYGPSYFGYTQWAAASCRPDGLEAIAPAVTTTDCYAAPCYSDGGAMSLQAAHFWATLMAFVDARNHLESGGEPDALTALGSILAEPEAHLRAVPVADQPHLARQMPWWRDWTGHATRDSYWRELAVADRIEEVTTPALHIGGWYDVFINNTLRTYAAMRKSAGSTAAREGQLLVVGPWDHMSYTATYPDRHFGLAAGSAAADLTSLHRRFFDRWLRGDEDALAGVPRVHIFVMGVDHWRDENDWPLPDTQYLPYYLGGGGSANSAQGDGTLSRAAPTVENCESFVYDPLCPVPSRGGRMLLAASRNAVGPVDQRDVEARDDVLCFTTEVLEGPVEVTGHISLVLHVKSSAVDTDFTGKVVDVFPDGRAICLTEGILRVRYRNSLVQPELMEPGQLYEIVVDLAATSNVFRSGHRIRLEVSSSNFPRYDRNTNTGHAMAQDAEDDMCVAVNQVLHGPRHLSRLVMPVIER